MIIPLFAFIYYPLGTVGFFALDLQYGRQRNAWLDFYVINCCNRTLITTLLFLLFAVSSLECCLTSVCSVTEKEKRKEGSLWRIALLLYDLLWT